jgi:predicted nucleic acid-binding protein
MKKAFIETSVFVRFLTRDVEEKYQECAIFFEQVSLGKILPYTSNTVISEIIFILDRHYSFPKKKILAAIDKLLALRNLTLIEKTDTRKALTIFKKHNIKYEDCLISAQVPPQTILTTYDKDFTKIPSLKTTTPKGILA